LLDLVDEPLDQVARAVQARAEADRVFAIALRRDVGHARSISGAKTISRPTTSDEQRMEFALPEALELVQIRRFQEP
jgi:hypothetical protein